MMTQDGKKEDVVEEWVTVTSMEDLYKLNIDVNFRLHEYKSQITLVWV